MLFIHTFLLFLLLFGFCSKKHLSLIFSFSSNLKSGRHILNSKILDCIFPKLSVPLMMTLSLRICKLSLSKENKIYKYISKINYKYSFTLNSLLQSAFLFQTFLSNKSSLRPVSSRRLIYFFHNFTFFILFLHAGRAS